MYVFVAKETIFEGLKKYDLSFFPKTLFYDRLSDEGAFVGVRKIFENFDIL